MRQTHLRQVDLNLLLALQALLEERHVTRASKRSFLSQPAMSRALERLREMFGDALLIRSGRAAWVSSSVRRRNELTVSRALRSLSVVFCLAAKMKR